MKSYMEELLRISSKYHSILLALIDAVSVMICYIFTWIMLVGRISLTQYKPILIKSGLLFLAIFLLVYLFAGMYQSIWRYAETSEFFRCVIASAVAVILFMGATSVLKFELQVPISSYMLAAAFSVSITLYYRMAYRIYRNNLNRERGTKKTNRVMIVGTGTTGASLISEFNRRKNTSYDVVCALDDDKGKLNKNILGVKVAGRIKDVEAVAKNYKVDTIILAMPSATRQQKLRAVSYCSKVKCRLRTVPDLADMVMENDEDNLVSTIRDVNVEELLGRDVINIGNKRYEYVTGKRVLITGGGGSIGSELSRQVAAARPKELVILDIYENNAYEIQQELIGKYGESLNLKVEIASVRDSKKMDALFAKYVPEIVFHAAAHKHVPLMEDVPEEAIKNNIYGTWNIARCADKYNTRRFVMISTDKAVNPTNIMGATKRVCEMIVQSMNQISNTEFVAVRFGNVLGSNGSVIPLFKKQIENGGPVTVTHPDIIRYFMTISEAVMLVLTAGEMAQGGEIFVLNMGEPVKILSLAENLIRLSGFEPYEDIKIVFTGLRPGEKLYEELLMSEEGLKKTPNKKIFIGEPINISHEYLFDFLTNLKPIAYANEKEHVIELLHEIVPTFINHEEKNKVLANV